MIKMFRFFAFLTLALSSYATWAQEPPSQNPLATMFKDKNQIEPNAPAASYSLYIPWLCPADDAGHISPITLSGNVNFVDKTYSFQRQITPTDQALTFNMQYGFSLESGAITLSRKEGLSIEAKIQKLMGRGAKLKLTNLDSSNPKNNVAEFALSYDNDITLILAHSSAQEKKSITLSKNLTLKLEDQANAIPVIQGTVTAFGKQVAATLVPDQQFYTDVLVSFTLDAVKISDMFPDKQDTPEGEITIKNAWFQIVNFASTQYNEAESDLDEHKKTLPKDTLVVFSGIIEKGEQYFGGTEIDLRGLNVTGAISQNILKITGKTKDGKVLRSDGLEKYEELAFALTIDWTRDPSRVTFAFDLTNANLQIKDKDKKPIIDFLGGLHLELSPGRIVFFARDALTANIHVGDQVMEVFNLSTLKFTFDYNLYTTMGEIGFEAKCPPINGMPTELQGLDLLVDFKYQKSPNFPIRPEQVEAMSKSHTTKGYSLVASKKDIENSLMTTWSLTGRLKREKPITLPGFSFYGFLIEWVNNPFVGKYWSVKCKTKIANQVFNGSIRSITSEHMQEGEQKKSGLAGFLSSKILIFTADLPTTWSPADLIPGAKGTVSDNIKWQGSQTNFNQFKQYQLYQKAADSIQSDVLKNQQPLLSDSTHFKQAYDSYAKETGANSKEEELVTKATAPNTKPQQISAEEKTTMINLTGKVSKHYAQKMATIDEIQNKIANTKFDKASKNLDFTQAILKHFQLTDAQLSIASGDYWSPELNTWINKGLTVFAKLKSGPILDGIQTLLGVKKQKEPDLDDQSADIQAQGIGSSAQSDIDLDLQGIDTDTKEDKLKDLIDKTEGILGADEAKPESIREIDPKEASYIVDLINKAKTALEQAGKESSSSAKTKIINDAYTKLKYSSKTINDRLQDTTVFLNMGSINPLKWVLGASFPLSLTLPKTPPNADKLEHTIDYAKKFLTDNIQKQTLTGAEITNIQAAIDFASDAHDKAKKIEATNKDEALKIINGAYTQLQNSSPQLAKQIKDVGTVIAKQLNLELGLGQKGAEIKGVPLPRITLGGTFQFKPSEVDPWLELDGRLSFLLGFVSVSANLKPQWKDEYGFLHNEWDNPFGIPVLAFGNFGFDISFGPGFPTGFAVEGTLYIGDTKLPLKDRMMIEVAGGMNPMMPTATFFVGKLKNIDSKHIIHTAAAASTKEADRKALIEKYKNLPNFGFEEVTAYFAPYGSQIGSDVIPQGITFKGLIDIAGWKGGGEVSMSMPTPLGILFTGGLRGKFMMSNLIFDTVNGIPRVITVETDKDRNKPDRFVIVKITNSGLGKDDKGPVVELEVNMEKQEFKADVGIEFANGALKEAALLDITPEKMIVGLEVGGTNFSGRYKITVPTIAAFAKHEKDIGCSIELDPKAIQKYVPHSEQLIKMLSTGIPDGKKTQTPTVQKPQRHHAQVYNASSKPLVLKLKNGDIASLKPGTLANRITVSWEGKGLGTIGDMSVILEPGTVYVVEQTPQGALTLSIAPPISSARIYNTFPEELPLKLEHGDTIKLSSGGLASLKTIEWTGVGNGIVISSRYGSMNIILQNKGTYKIQASEHGSPTIITIPLTQQLYRAKIANVSRYDVTLNINNGDLLKLPAHTDYQTVFWFGDGSGTMESSRGGRINIALSPGGIYQYKESPRGEQTIIATQNGDLRSARIFNTLPEELTLKLDNGDKTTLPSGGIVNLKQVGWIGDGTGSVTSSRYGSMPIALQNNTTYKIQPATNNAPTITIVASDKPPHKARVTNSSSESVTLNLDTGDLVVIPPNKTYQAVIWFGDGKGTIGNARRGFMPIALSPGGFYDYKIFASGEPTMNGVQGAPINTARVFSTLPGELRLELKNGDTITLSSNGTASLRIVEWIGDGAGSITSRRYGTMPIVLQNNGIYKIYASKNDAPTIMGISSNQLNTATIANTSSEIVTLNLDNGDLAKLAPNSPQQSVSWFGNGTGTIGNPAKGFMNIGLSAGQTYEYKILPNGAPSLTTP